MRVTKITFIVLGLFYIFLWVLALNGASSLIDPLAVPPILAVLVAGGVALNRFMGIKPRKQHFVDPKEKDETEE
jgi:small-conductance mechanosensitive channel